MVKKRQ